MLAGAIPTLPFEWKRGQHIALIGDTGTGKTTVTQAILAARRYALVLRSKADDVIWQGYAKVRRALPALDSPMYERILLEPSFEDQWREFAIALDRAFRQGNWAVFVDDLPHVQELDRRHLLLVKRLLIMGRSVGISTITAMQRPVDVSRYSIAEARITVSFMLEGRDVQNIKDSTSPLMAEVVSGLGEHDVAMFHRPTREVWAGRYDLEGGLFIGAYLGSGRARSRSSPSPAPIPASAR